MTGLLLKAGQSLLVVAGVGIGLLRSRTLFQSGWPGISAPDGTNSRIASLSLELASLSARTQVLESARAEMVSRSELDLALDRAFEPLYRDLDRRFQNQSESVESLRVMVARTDELLDRVLENLEAMDHRAAA